MALTEEQQKRFDAVCEQIAIGKSIPQISSMEGMPDKATIYRWIAKDEEVCDKYTRAKSTGVEVHIDEMLEIADTEEDVNRARLKIDTIKWTASKLKAKKYGDKMDHKVEGEMTVNVIQNFSGADNNS